MVHLANKTKKYGAKDPRQVTLTLTKTLVMFVARDLLPLSIVDGQGFQELVHSLDPKYQIPSRKHLSRMLLHK